MVQYLAVGLVCLQESAQQPDDRGLWGGGGYLLAMMVQNTGRRLYWLRMNWSLVVGTRAVPVCMS